MRKAKYPCGVCHKNVNKSSKAIMCNGSCEKYHHFKCLDMCFDEYEKIDKLKLKWVCNKCSVAKNNKVNCINLNVEKPKESVKCNDKCDNEGLFEMDEELRNTTIMTNVINKELENEVENLLTIVKTQNEDLAQANKQIIDLKSHNNQLETLVLLKEENIVMLTEKITMLENQLKDKSNSQCGKGLESLVLSRNLRIQGERVTPTSTPIHNTSFNSEPQLTGKVNRETLFSSIAKRRLNKTQTSSKSNYIEPEISFISHNRFEVLTTDDDGDNHSNGIKETTVEKCNKIKSNKETKKKILICADSHGRNLSWHINKKQQFYEAVGYVKPGGRSEQVLNLNIRQENLGKEDVCVIITGTNDVAKNEGNKIIIEVKKVLDENKNTKFVVVGVPNRYDLADWSCVNNAVKKTNSELKQLCEKYSNAVLVESSKASRQLHTRHGMHLNETGKGWLSEQILEAIVTKCNKSKIDDFSSKLHPTASATLTTDGDLGNSPATVNVKPA